MKILGPLCLFLTALAPACGGGDDAGDDDGPETPGVDAGDDGPESSFRVVSSDIEIAAGDERTHCYYTTLPLDRDVGVHRWASTMTPGSHHLIMYALSSTTVPDGTIIEDCDVLGGGGFSIPTWTYSAQTPEAEYQLP